MSAESGDRPRSWEQVWSARACEVTDTTIEALLRADGFDTPLGQVDARRWVAFVTGWAERLGIGPGATTYEVGCGAGAFLAPLADRGSAVGGIDISEPLIDLARRALPSGAFTVGAATGLDVELRADVVVAHSVFQYFPDHRYAGAALQAMAGAARRAVVVLDVPDRARRAAALAARTAASGGPEAYRRRYEGLDHLDFTAAWFADRFARWGFRVRSVEDQWLVGYGNSRFRFNVWAEPDPSAPPARAAGPAAGGRSIDGPDGV